LRYQELSKIGGTKLLRFRAFLAMLQSKEIKMSRTILYAILITLLVAGCGQSPTPEPLKTATLEPSATNLPVLDGEWIIKMKHSGGIMGLLRSVEISSDGKFIVVDERANKTITGELFADELSKISELVSSSEYMHAIKPDGMACADCFIYDLTIQSNDQLFSIQLNDINLPGSGLEALVTQLRGLIETKLK
jgi:hypothetical protein